MCSRLVGCILVVVVVMADSAGAQAISLDPCPATPNCVSSLATDPGHRIEPLRFHDAPAAAWLRLQKVLDKLPRTRIIERTPQRLRAEFTSRVFRFVDDVVCVMDEAAGVIQVRSASRVGYSDFGVNRRRVETIRALFDRD